MRRPAFAFSSPSLLLVLLVALLVAACSGGAAVHASDRTSSSSSSSSLPAGPPASVAAVSTTTQTTTPPIRATDCLLVTDDRTGAVLRASDADTPLPAASAQKLIVAAAALDRLGGEFRFITTVVASQPPVGGAVGDLWLVGGGDPLLATAAYNSLVTTPGSSTASYQPTPLSVLADGLARAGVRVVRGTVHGDDSRYESLRYLPTWPATTNVGEFDVGPLSALELDQGLDHWRPAIVSPDPASHAAATLAALIGAHAGPDGAPPPGGVVLAAVPSPPLNQIVAEMLRASDNQIAELLVRELDRATGGRGTTTGGVAAVMRSLGHLGIPASGVSLVDGSGLSPTDRVTCRALLAALDLGDQPRFAALAVGLPQAGVSGTLLPLFRGTPIAGHLTAKGGYITGVTSLVGRLDAARPVRFAYVANGPFDYRGGIAMTSAVVTALWTGRF